MLNWKHFGRVHKFLYQLTGGRFGARMGWIDVALEGEYLAMAERKIPLVWLRRQESPG